MLRRLLPLAIVGVLLVVGCAPGPVPTGTEAQPTPSPTSTPVTFPIAFEPSAPLIDGGAHEVLVQLMQVSEHRAALKLDVTTTHVTLTVLDENQRPAAFRWQDGEINAVDSDMQYFDQATFYPGSFPLDNVRGIFSAARLYGASGELMLQIMEHHSDKIFMTVSSRAESTTVFFDRYGTLVPRLRTRSAADIRRGIEDLTTANGKVLVIGFSPATGYWADVEVSPGTVERRVRKDGVPVFAAPRGQAPSTEPLAVEDIDPGILASRQARYGDGEPCTVEIKRPEPDLTPLIRFECPTQTVTTRLDGTRVDY